MTIINLNFIKNAIVCFCFALISYLAISCQNSSNNTASFKKQDTISENDYLILNSTFVHLVVPAPEGAEREFGYDNYVDILHIFPDSMKKVIFFTPYLVSMNGSDFFRTDFFYKEERIEKIKDEEFKKLASLLFNNCPSTLKINPKRVQNIGMMRMVCVEPGTLPKREIGECIITYSRIVYNEPKDKACFYFEKSCSGLNGYGKLVFMMKKNDIWEIVDNVLFWVS